MSRLTYRAQPTTAETRRGVWLYEERGGRTRHACISYHHDGSGSICIYRDSGTPKVKMIASISFDAAGLEAILSLAVGKPDFKARKGETT